MVGWYFCRQTEHGQSSTKGREIQMNIDKIISELRETAKVFGTSQVSWSH